MTELAAAEEAVEDLEAHPPNLVAYRGALGDTDGTTRAYRGPAFLFPDELPPAPRAVVITEANRSACSANYQWVIDEWDDPIHPVAVALDDGAAVSVCHSARTSDAASEAGVETIEAARGRGYAPEVVAEWARGVRAAGRLPMYSTEWTNTASRCVASKLALQLYGETRTSVESGAPSRRRSYAGRRTAWSEPAASDPFGTRLRARELKARC